MTCSIRQASFSAVLFVDLLRHFPAHIGQMQEIVAVHRQETPVPQDAYCMTDTRF